MKDTKSKDEIIRQLIFELEEVVTWTETEKCVLRPQEIKSIRGKIKLGQDALTKRKVK